jgi:hypothetical protein
MGLAPSSRNANDQARTQTFVRRPDCGAHRLGEISKLQIVMVHRKASAGATLTTRVRLTRSETGNQVPLQRDLYDVAGQQLSILHNVEAFAPAFVVLAEQ